MIDAPTHETGLNAIRNTDIYLIDLILKRYFNPLRTKKVKQNRKVRNGIAEYTKFEMQKAMIKRTVNSFLASFAKPLYLCG